jgi:hypothetical protein
MVKVVSRKRKIIYRIGERFSKFLKEEKVDNMLEFEGRWGGDMNKKSPQKSNRSNGTNCFRLNYYVVSPSM